MLRVIGFAAILLLAACNKPVTTSNPSTRPDATPSQPASCKLPVYWNESVPPHTELEPHGAFVDVPTGTVTDVGRTHGTTYDGAAHRWLGIPRNQMSPDGARYVTFDQSHTQIHVLDVATGSDRVAYSGPTLFEVIAFEADAIYLTKIVNSRQGSTENLYRLNPAGGSPELVLGGDRHFNAGRWDVVSGGAAWGIDYRQEGSVTKYLVIRLDLGSGVVTQWLEGDYPDVFRPIGTDAKGRLYVSNGHELWRLAHAGQVDRLLTGVANIGGGGPDVIDSNGVWLVSDGSVWLYSDASGARQFLVGPAREPVTPAGHCA